MKLCKCVAISAIACFVAPYIAAIEEPPRSLRSTHTIFSEEKFECVLFNIQAMMENPDVPEIRLACMADDDLSYRVMNVPDNFFGDTPMVSGITRISVLASAVSHAEFAVDVAEGNGKIIDNPSANVGRYTKTKKTARTVLVVRVFDSNGENGPSPSTSKEYLSTKVFGTGGTDVYNLVSGYDTCSGGMTTFTPGSFTNSINGVMDLYLLDPISTQTAYDIELMANAALAALPNWSWDTHDHIMYVLSDTINFLGAAAFAYLPGKRSVFREGYAATYLVQMHEFGHNLGHHHSGLGDEEYADPTCWMGSHAYEDEGPPACFNGAKSWMFGWYSTHHVELHPETENADLKLIGINDYLNHERSSKHATVVKINGDFETLYMMYNKKEGINSGTAGYGDDVTIVHQSGSDEISWFRAGLGAGDTRNKYEAVNFSDGKKLVVEVCEMVSGTPDIARTIVYLDTVNNISCADTSSSSPMSSPQVSPTASPQASPTASPQASPTASPQASPTASPQASPTASPQASPTTSPTASPQTSPTASPQASPTASPQASPTASPQASPTASPQASPTASPQASPTASPQASPTASPQVSPTACTENKNDKFLLKKKRNDDITKKCSWLSERSEKQREKVCSGRVNMSSSYSAPQYVCQASCNSCDPCYENPRSKFFLKYEMRRGKIKSCKWLNNRDAQERDKACKTSTTSFDGYKAPAVVCPKACDKVGVCK